jgi:hypothetical protein
LFRLLLDNTAITLLDIGRAPLIPYTARFGQLCSQSVYFVRQIAQAPTLILFWISSPET